jgi:hypothetical protein
MRRRLVQAAVMLGGMLLPATVLGQGTPGPRAPQVRLAGWRSR